MVGGGHEEGGLGKARKGKGKSLDHHRCELRGMCAVMCCTVPYCTGPYQEENMRIVDGIVRGQWREIWNNEKLGAPRLARLKGVVLVSFPE